MRLVYYWKPDCAPCAEKKPVIAAIVAATGVDCEVVNAEAEPERARAHYVKAVPCLVVTDDRGTRLAGFARGLIDEVRVRRFLGR